MTAKQQAEIRLNSGAVAVLGHWGRTAGERVHAMLPHVQLARDVQPPTSMLIFGVHRGVPRHDGPLKNLGGGPPERPVQVVLHVIRRRGHGRLLLLLLLCCCS